MVFLVTLHELGHYLMAWRLGWKPKFVFQWKKLRFAVITREVHINIDTTKDFFETYQDLARFNGSSTLFALAGITFLLLFELMSFESSFFMAMLFTLYGLHEIMNPKFESVED